MAVKQLIQRKNIKKGKLKVPLQAALLLACVGLERFGAFLNLVGWRVSNFALYLAKQ
jgi:hypothetical protein